jgi:hypothetical protein
VGLASHRRLHWLEDIKNRADHAREPDGVVSPRSGQAELGTISRAAGRASRLLRISELDERMSVENAATLALAKKLALGRLRHKLKTIGGHGFVTAVVPKHFLTVWTSVRPLE